jgi:3-oxoacyl-[acyl-carrier-protein] synthase-3
VQSYNNVYITGVGHFLPGPKIDNDEMSDFIGPINKQSDRIKRRILGENGIVTRHYGIDREGRTTTSMAQMAAVSSRESLKSANIELNDLDLIATGTVSGDVVVPGFSNMLQGELKAPPLETISINGICSSGMTAFKAAASSIEMGEHTNALVNATEYPSRLFKSSRFENFKEVDFNSHFLRWMLSDGSGSFVLSNKPKNEGLSFKIKWVHNKSFSGDFPTCMTIGYDKTNSGASYLDYDSVAEAEGQGQFYLRQDIRLLPNLFEVGFTEYLNLVESGHINPMKIDHFLCHYSSEKFSGTIKDLMMKADVFIPEDRWYSNLSTSGNTGSASIFIMMSEFLKEKEVKAGEQILFFVPESGRFSVSYALLEVCEDTNDQSLTKEEEITAPITDSLKNEFPDLFLKLSQIWSDYRSEVFRNSMVQKIFAREITREDYKKWMSLWIPQVQVGSVWMRNAIAHLPEDLKPLAEIIETHAGEEQFDFKILYNDYKALGGEAPLDTLKRCPAGDALNEFMMSTGRTNPLALLGGIFIIEGTGQKIIPALLPFLKDRLGENLNIYRFLTYHGENDQAHLERWASAVSIALSTSPNMADDIVSCAQKVSKLYSMQWSEIASEVSKL